MGGAKVQFKLNTSFDNFLKEGRELDIPRLLHGNKEKNQFPEKLDFIILQMLDRLILFYTLWKRSRQKSSRFFPHIV